MLYIRTYSPPVYPLRRLCATIYCSLGRKIEQLVHLRRHQLIHQHVLTPAVMREASYLSTRVSVYENNKNDFE